MKGPLPTGGIYDIGQSLGLARKGGTLSMKHAAGSLQFAHLRADRQLYESDLPPLPLINSMTELIVTMPRLAENIDRCILSEG